MKFTKGDIIVHLQKLHYLQKWHTKRLLEQEPPDWPNLERYICEPIENFIRSHVTQSQEHAKLDSELATPLQYLTKSGEGNEDIRKEGHQYILKAVRAVSLVDLSKLEEFVLDEGHWGLFWRPSKESLELSAGQFQDKLRSADSTDLMFAADNRPVAAGEALGHLRDVLSAVPEEDWNETTLGPVVQAASVELTIEPANGGGYHLFRWALLCATKSPGISGVMEVLGREETLRRLTLAQQVAERPVTRSPDFARARERTPERLEGKKS